MKESLYITYFKLELGNLIKAFKEKLNISMCICLKLGWLVLLDSYVDINNNQSLISLLTAFSITRRDNYYYSIFSA